MKNRILLSALTILFLGSFVTPRVFADDEPEPGVARISITQGDVSTQRGDSGEWVAATVNAPVMAGDKVATAAHSRAELQLDFANVLRLGESAEANLAALSAKQIQVQISAGLADFVVFKGTEAGAEIDTPNMAVRPLMDGVYRIQVNSADETQLTVRQGEAEVSTPQGSTKVEGDQVIIVRGTDNPEYRVENAAAKDEWDRWNKERNEQIEQAQAWQHTDHYYTGSSDLDEHGKWVQVPGYDWCWTPYVDAGWVPYSDGRWTWEPYWGWTWVSYEPWGWAPYHYGRWFWGGASWCWWPGVGYWGPRPYWAPAYVSFFGFGGGGWGVGLGFGGFGFGFGSIGWLPLGPYDGCHPWWGHGHGYNAVNITNITNVTNIANGRAGGFGNPMRGPMGSNLQAVMTNSHVRGALSTVSAQNFANGHIAHNIQPASESMLRGGSMIKGTLPVVPTRASLQPGTRGVTSGALPSAAANNQHFFTRGGSVGNRVPRFSSEASQIRNMVQRGPTAGAGERTLFGQTGLRAESQLASGPRSNPANLGARTNSTSPGRAGAMAAQAGAGRSGAPTSQSAGNPGWQRFGTGNQANRGPAGIKNPGSGGFSKNTFSRPQGTPTRAAAPAPQGSQGGWQKFATHTGPSTGRTGFAQAAPRVSQPSPAIRPGTGSAGPRAQQGGWQRFSSHSAAPTREGAPAGQYGARFGSSGRGWNAPAPRAGGGGYGSSRPPLQLNRPILQQRSWGGGYSGGGRTYSAPSGGGRTYSAPSGGGRGSSSAPRGGGGWGGGGGGHASGSSGSRGRR